MLKNYFDKFKTQKLQTLIIFGLVIFYLATHLPGLVSLPVFADESIYIRWAQLIIDDWQRYLFFPMNDGKTPLFIWLLVPFQFIFKDQLFAGRFLAMLVGLVQVLMNMKIIKELGGRSKTQILTGIFTIVLPFWYFHHRMALMDGLLTLLISVVFLFLIKVSKNQTKQIFDKSNLRSIILAGVFFGLAMLTKIPAVLFIPAFYFSIFLGAKKDLKNFKTAFVKVSFSILIGLSMFAMLKINPVFGQLFSRGGDFLFPVSEIINGSWKQTIPSVANYINYFFVYLTPGIIIFLITGLFLKKHKVTSHVLFWSGVFFIFPIALMGKSVYPRYLFPASLFFTLAAMMGLESIVLGVFKSSKLQGKSDKLWKTLLVGVFVSLLISNTIVYSLNYIQLSVLDSNNTPFVSSDVTQYLTEWSSGHGVKETVELIKRQAEIGTVAVATEGSFGTLPDGLLMYFYRTNVDNLYLEGVGYPINGIPQSFADRANKFDKKLLVVNSHRMNLMVDRKYLVAEYCRPFNASCLQVWNITENFQDYIKN
ncbi:glycosyltransferase family 39 protein [Patescibacteria group bacterium]|nr:glycosyltransferase family 39 protein [Patescibacteria group bacterium]